MISGISQVAGKSSQDPKASPVSRLEGCWIADVHRRFTSSERLIEERELHISIQGEAIQVQARSADVLDLDEFEALFVFRSAGGGMVHDLGDAQGWHRGKEGPARWSTPGLLPSSLCGFGPRDDENISGDRDWSGVGDSVGSNPAAGSSRV